MGNLEFIDWALFAVFMVISLGIGVYYACTGGNQKTTHEFLLGNRQLKVLPTTLSLLMTYLSAIVILGNTAEMFKYGIRYLFWKLIGFPIAIALSAVIFVPFMFPLQYTSIYEVCAAALSFFILLFFLSVVVFRGADFR